MGGFLFIADMADFIKDAADKFPNNAGNATAVALFTTKSIGSICHIGEILYPSVKSAVYL